MRRLAIVAACVGVALALCLLVLFALVDGEAVADRVQRSVLVRVSESIGREITAETVRARILPNPHVTLSALVIHGRRGEPPLVEAEALDVDLALWPLVRSFGREIRVQRLELIRPEVNALRDRRGRWSFDELNGESERVVSIAKIRVKDGVLRIIDRSGSHGEATVGLTHIDLDVENPTPEDPIRIIGAAAFASDRRNLQLDLEIGRGARPDLRGRLRVDAAELMRLEGLLPAKLARVIHGGTIALDAGVATRDGSYVLDGTAALTSLRMRGEPVNGGLRVRAHLDPTNPRDARADIEQIALRGPGIDLTGDASYTATPGEFRFALRGPLLDLRSVLGVIPEDEPDEATGSRTAALPARIGQEIERVALHGSLEVDRVVCGRLEAQKLSAIARVESGILRLEKARAEFYGGSMDASGTTVNLLRSLPRWNLQARLADMEAARVMSAFAGGASAVRGNLDAALDLRGEGSAWEQVRRSLSGTGAVAFTDGELGATDLTAALAEAAGSTRPMPIRELNASFTVRGGWLELREPLTFTSDAGAGRMEGRIGLDLSLALRGFVLIARGASRFVEVPLAVRGTVRAPEVEVDAGPVVRRHVEETVRRQARRRVDDLMKRARQRRR